tara:strand:+ start:180 stop:677 length:498 start_codon:yes stop_codon:yes gene_type:complete
MSINWEIIAALAETLSALAVMASLIYVGVQVRGDRQARVAATIQARQEGTREILLAQATSPELGSLLGNVYAQAGSKLPGMQSIEDCYHLSSEEAYRVCCLWVALFRKYEADFNLPLTEQEKDHATGLIRMLKSGAPAKWWPEAKDAWFSQEFIDRVEGMMRDSN